MGYQKANGTYARTRAVTVEAGATKTATFTSPAVELGDVADLRLDLAVTAASGTTPTLDVAIQTSADGSTNWTAVASFAQKTGAATEHKLFGPVDRFVRYVATIAGTTPSFTYSIAGEGV